MPDQTKAQNSDNQPLDRSWKKVFWIVEIGFIAGIIIYNVTVLSKGLTVPWIWHPDELPYTAEVLKLLKLNFNQNFFDIPGTPFMFLTAILWALWYAVLSLSRQIPPDLSIKLFTFQNFDQFYYLMRLEVLIFYALSIALTYILGKRLTNAVGGAVAALLLASFPPYAAYSSFVRTESMGICLAIAALLLTLDAIENSKPKKYFLAGICSGVATAARYHFVLATLPQIFLYLSLPKAESSNIPKPPPRWVVTLSVAIGSVFIFGGIFALFMSLKLIQPNWLSDRFLISPEDSTLSKALSLMRKLWMALGLGAGLLFIAFWIPRLRPWVERIIQPPQVLVFTGFSVGLLLGTPTFLWRGSYLLRSIQLYSNWINYDRLKLSPINQYIDLYSSYWRIVAPTIPLAFLLILGTLLILIQRKIHLYPIVLGVVLVFLAQPVLLPSEKHRVLPWLHYLSLVEAYPFAVLYKVISRANKRHIIIQFMTFCSLLYISFSFVEDGAKMQAYNIENFVVPRLKAVQEVSNWLKTNTEQNSIVFMSFYSFNEQVYYTLMEAMGASVPRIVREPRLYYSWWSERTYLLSFPKGYVVACKQDTEQYEQELNNKKSGTGVNPFKEPGFTKLATFSGGGYDLTIFRFDAKSILKK